MRNDPRDRLIRALATQLGAERETRAAIADIVSNGGIDREVLLALLQDPIPAWSQEDLNRADRLATSAASIARSRPDPALQARQRGGGVHWKS